MIPEPIGGTSRTTKHGDQGSCNKRRRLLPPAHRRPEPDECGAEAFKTKRHQLRQVERRAQLS